VTLAGRQALAVVVSLVVVAAVATGVIMLGAPSEERARRLDQRRVSNLQGIGSAVTFYHAQNGRLPASLDELSRQPGVGILNDPVTGAPFGYRPLGADEYELCGTFDRPSRPTSRSGVDAWKHPAGAHCFTDKVPKRPAQ
jgi:hypothetical protein